MKKIYIAGGAGMLGKSYYDILNLDNNIVVSDIDLNEKWIGLLDFRDIDEYRKKVIDFKPDYLLHLGAHTSLEFCYQNIDECYSTNTLGVENAVHISNELNIPLLYISTAGIFDGQQNTYDDWDLPNPLGHYARSKYMGERYVVEHSNKYVVCRAGWMMGGGPTKDKKFINKIIKQLQSGAHILNVVNDKLGTPTYTVDFVRNSMMLMDRGLWGVYNMVCDGVTGRYEVASELLEIISRNDVLINQVSSDFFKKEYFSPRPPSERLICSKLKLRGLYKMRDWRVCLREYLKKDFPELFRD